MKTSLVVVALVLAGSTFSLPAIAQAAPQATGIIQTRQGVSSIPSTSQLRSAFRVSTPVYVIGRTDLSAEEVSELQAIARENRQLFLFLIENPRDLEADLQVIKGIINSAEVKGKVVHPRLKTPDGVYLVITNAGPSGKREWRLRTEELEDSLNVGEKQFFDADGTPLKLASKMIEARQEGKGVPGMVQVLMDEINGAVDAHERHLGFVQYAIWAAEVLAVLGVLAALGFRVRSTGNTYREALADLGVMSRDLDALLKEAQERMENSEFDAALVNDGDLEINETEKVYAEIAKLRLEAFLILEAGGVFQTQIASFLEGRRVMLDRLTGKTSALIRELMSSKREGVDLNGVDAIPRANLESLIALAKQGGEGIDESRSLTLPELLELAQDVNAKAASLEQKLEHQKSQAEPEIVSQARRLSSLKKRSKTQEEASFNRYFSTSELISTFSQLDEETGLLADAQRELNRGNFVGAYNRAREAGEILSRIESVISVAETAQSELIPVLQAVCATFERGDLPFDGNWAHVRVAQVSKKLVEVGVECCNGNIAVELEAMKAALLATGADLEAADSIEQAASGTLPVACTTLLEKLEETRASLFKLLTSEVLKGELGSVSSGVRMLSEEGRNPEVIAQTALDSLPQVRRLLQAGEVSEAGKAKAKVESLLLEANRIINATTAEIGSFRTKLATVSQERNQSLTDIEDKHAPRVIALGASYSVNVLDGVRSKCGINLPLAKALAESKQGLEDSQRYEQRALQRFLEGSVLSAVAEIEQGSSMRQQAEKLFQQIVEIELELQKRLREARSGESELVRMKAELGGGVSQTHARAKAKSHLESGSTSLKRATAQLSAETVDLLEVERQLAATKEAYGLCKKELASDFAAFNSATSAIQSAVSEVRSAESAVSRARSTSFTHATVSTSSASSYLSSAESSLRSAQQALQEKRFEDATSKARAAKSSANDAIRSANSAVASAQSAHNARVAELNAASSYSSGSYGSSSSSDSSGFSGGSFGGGGDSGFTGGSM